MNHVRGKELTFIRRIVLIFGAAPFLFASAAFSQQTQLDALAAQTVEALKEAHVKKVVVLDFSGPGLKVTQLGRDLADQFSADVSAVSDGNFKVLDRSRLSDFVQKQNLPPIVMGFAWGAFPADKFGADALIRGELSTPQEKPSLRLELQCFKTKPQNRKIAEFQAEFEQTAQTKSSLVSVIPGTNFAQYAEPGKNGVTQPACERCPTPRYTDEAFNARLQGEILLGAVITTEGKASHIVVLRGMPEGMTDSAIQRVKNWRFKPSLGPDANPVATWILIELDFNIH